jgi:hypothetical protein
VDAKTKDPKIKDDRIIVKAIIFAILTEFA